MNPQVEQKGRVGLRSLFSLSAIIVVLLVVAYFFYGLQPAAATREGDVREANIVRFTIAKGEGFRTIGARLSQEGLVRSLAVFKFYALLAGEAQRFQPGAYDLSPAMSVPAIVGTITEGSRGDILVTVPEGSTVKDIDGILAEAGVIREGSLAALRPEVFSLQFPALARVSSLEGILFPDTYYFTVDMGAERAARTMIETFMRKSMPIVQDRSDWYEILVLASLLEREVITFADGQVVAGILLKRMRLGMPLQVDATISYAKCAGSYRTCESVQIARGDLDFPSPYNTYTNRGFPPTPIASPSTRALRAAAEPVASPYLYYLSARGTKETIFSRTLDEHNMNRTKYL